MLLVACRKWFTAGASRARVAKMWAYILAVLSREENHDVLVVASVGDASRDEIQVGGVVDRQNWLSVMLRERRAE
jgi:hypothetical protein